MPVRLYVCSPGYANGDSEDPAEQAGSLPNVPSWGDTKATRVPLMYTKPKVRVIGGTPAFKTSKLLGSRAIVSDSYSKSPHAVGSPEPGDGINTHRDGYNVLYGDYSAKWYGDPQQRIIWWNTPLDYSSYRTMSNFDTTSLCEFYARIPSFYYIYHVTGWYYPPAGPYKETSWHSVWHQFDLSYGIDNVPYPGFVP